MTLSRFTEVFTLKSRRPRALFHDKFPPQLIRQLSPREVLADYETKFRRLTDPEQVVDSSDENSISRYWLASFFLYVISISSESRRAVLATTLRISGKLKPARKSRSQNLRLMMSSRERIRLRRWGRPRVKWCFPRGHEGMCWACPPGQRAHLWEGDQSSWETPLIELTLWLGKHQIDQEFIRETDKPSSLKEL